MANTFEDRKEEFVSTSLAMIKKHKLIMVEDVIAFLPCGKTTFYTLFPDKSDELNVIKDALEKNKVNTKIKLRKMMETSPSPAHTAMLYRLCATPEELDKLSMSKNVNETTHTVNMPVIQWVDATE